MLQIRQLKLKCYLQVTYRNSAPWQYICQAVFVNRRSCSNAQWLVCPSVPLASHTVRANLKHVFTAARLLAFSASKLRFSQPVLLFLVARLANQRLDTVMTSPLFADRRRTNAGLVYRSGQRASQEQTQLHVFKKRPLVLLALAYGRTSASARSQPSSKASIAELDCPCLRRNTVIALTLAVSNTYEKLTRVHFGDFALVVNDSII